MQEAIVHLKQRDPVLRGIIEQVGDFNMQFLDPTMETLVRSIIFQQLSGKVARVIFRRLLDAAGGQLTAESILKLRPARMRALGISPQKTGYIRELARRTRAGEIEFECLPQMPDDDVITTLTVVKGIGVWTAHMFLMFALQRPDVLPTGDLGIRNAIRKAYGMADLPKPSAVEALGQPWRPYCTVASWYLWRSLDSIPGL